MGSSSSSKNYTSSVETSQTQVDNRIVDGDGANIGGNVTLSNTGAGSGTFNVTTTDYGALDAASELAGDALDFGDNISGRAFTSVNNSVEAVRTIAGDAGATISGALNKVTDFATSQQPDQSSSRTLQLLIVSMGVVGAVALWRRSK